ncbi:MAG: hypothetical protein HDR32_00100 [Treponema sp.]|nr:hypothetical protein [Treponema sp.]
MIVFCFMVMFCSLSPFSLRYDSTGGGGVSKRDFGNESSAPNSFPSNAADEFQPVAESASIAVKEFHPVDTFPSIAVDEFQPVDSFPPIAVDEFQAVDTSASITENKFHPVAVFASIAVDELHPVPAFPSGAGVEKAAENVYHAG